MTSNALAIGCRLGEFEIVGLVGEGGFGIVYLARDHSLHRNVAIKEYMPGTLAARHGESAVAVRVRQHQPAFDAGLRSFINEARLLAQFDHPALLKVFRFWEQNGTAYIAMPFYQGRTLKDLVLNEPNFVSEAKLQTLLVPLVDALAALHQENCYHRDISPDNILILGSGMPVLIDFGAARRIISELTQAVTIILKPGYAPVEQYADDAKQGPWTDVYALAAVMYFAIAAKAPPASVTRLLNDPLVPLRQLASPGFSSDFLHGIERGLEVRPEARPQTMAEFRDLLGLPLYRSSGHPESSRFGSPTVMPRSVVPDLDARGDPVSEPLGARREQSVPPSVGSTDKTVLISIPKTESAARVASPTRHRLFAGVATFALVLAAGVLMMFNQRGLPVGEQAPESAATPPPPSPIERQSSNANPADPASTPDRIIAGNNRDISPSPTIPPADISKRPPSASEPPTPATGRPIERARPIEGSIPKSPSTSASSPSSAFRLSVPLNVKPWGEVFVDEKSFGITPPLNAITLSEGTHWIELRHPGFRNHSMIFEVKRGDPEIRIVHEFK